MPSKWPGEWEVAQVDFVQTIGSKGTTEVRHTSALFSHFQPFRPPRRAGFLADVKNQKTSI